MSQPEEKRVPTPRRTLGDLLEQLGSAVYDMHVDSSRTDRSAEKASADYDVIRAEIERRFTEAASSETVPTAYGSAAVTPDPTRAAAVERFKHALDGAEVGSELKIRSPDRYKEASPSATLPQRLREQGYADVPHPVLGSAPCDKKYPWAYAVPQPMGAECDYLVFPDYGDAESHVADRDDEAEIIPLFPKEAPPSATRQTIPPLVVEVMEQLCYKPGEDRGFEHIDYCRWCHYAKGHEHGADCVMRLLARSDGAPPASATVPPGWCAVPVEPTQKMLDAGNAAEYGATTHRSAGMVWRAMLGALSDGKAAKKPGCYCQGGTTQPYCEYCAPPSSRHG